MKIIRSLFSGHDDQVFRRAFVNKKDSLFVCGQDLGILNLDHLKLFLGVEIDGLHSIVVGHPELAAVVRDEELTGH